MTDYDDDQYDDDREDSDDGQERPRQGEKPGWRKRLESDRDKARQKAAALERENAFLKAGVNPEDPKAKWLVKGYDGDLTPEAIKQAATDAGILRQAEEPPKDEVPAEEQQAHQRLEQTSEGASSGGQRDFHAEMRAAKSTEELHRIAREAGVVFAPGAYDPSADGL